MLRINGVNGFGFLKEVIYFKDSKITLFWVEVYQIDKNESPQFVHLMPDDCEKYHAIPSTAKSIFASPDEHEHAFLRMAA